MDFGGLKNTRRCLRGSKVNGEGRVSSQRFFYCASSTENLEFCKGFAYIFKGPMFSPFSDPYFSPWTPVEQPVDASVWPS